MAHPLTEWLFDRATAELKWMWPHPGTSDDFEFAELTESGLEYTFVRDPSDPGGGPGMDGMQSVEDFLQNGPRPDVHMPADIEAAVRAELRALHGRKAERWPTLKWRLRLAPALVPRLVLAQAELGHASLGVLARPSPEGTLVLFEGTVRTLEPTLGLFLAFSNPAGAAALKVNSGDVVVPLVAGKRSRSDWSVGEDLRLTVRTEVRKRG